MSQAVSGLSVSPADHNPAKAHFDATLLRCGVAVVNLVNTVPRTPTPEQVRDLIRATLQAGFESSEAGSLYEDEGGAKLGRSSDPSDPLAFQPIPDAVFPVTNDEFCKKYLPWVRMA